MKSQINPKRSLGALRIAKKTKKRSPDLLRQLHLQRSTLLEIVRQAKEGSGDEVMCNLAAWKNRDKGGLTYLSVELSPWYKPRTHRKNKRDVFNDLFDEEGE
jgi:hypothetical protein